MNIRMERESFGTICICALRYCFGRRTYMPGLVMEICTAHLKEFSDKDLGVMIDDLDHRRKMGLFGDPCDEEDWEKWERALNAERDRRRGEKRDRVVI